MSTAMMSHRDVASPGKCLSLFGALVLVAAVPAAGSELEVLHDFSGDDGFVTYASSTDGWYRASHYPGAGGIASAATLADGWLYGVGWSHERLRQGFIWRLAADGGRFEFVGELPNVAIGGVCDDCEMGIVGGPWRSVTRLTRDGDGRLYGVSGGAANLDQITDETRARNPHDCGYVFRVRPDGDPQIWPFPGAEQTVHYVNDNYHYEGALHCEDGYGGIASPLVEGPDGALYGVVRNPRGVIVDDGLVGSGPSGALYRFTEAGGIELLKRFDPRDADEGLPLTLVWSAARQRFYGLARTVRESPGLDSLYDLTPEAVAFEIQADGSDYRVLYRFDERVTYRRFDDEDPDYGDDPFSSVFAAPSSLLWSPTRQALIGIQRYTTAYRPGRWVTPDHSYCEPSCPPYWERGREDTQYARFFRLEGDGSSLTTLDEIDSSRPELGLEFATGLIEHHDGYLYGVARFGGDMTDPETGRPTHGSGTVFRLSPAGGFELMYALDRHTAVTTDMSEELGDGLLNDDGINPAFGLTSADDGALYGVAYRGGRKLNGTLFRFTPGEPQPPSLRFVLESSKTAGDLDYSDQLLPGESATFSWSGNLIRDCVASGAWEGERPRSGGETVTPPEIPGTYRYTLSCDSQDGVLTGTLSLTVNPREPALREVTGGGCVALPLLILTLMAVRRRRRTDLDPASNGDSK